MRNRILTGWTLRRGFYLAAGIFLLIQSIMDHEWLIALPGIYFASMGDICFRLRFWKLWNTSAKTRYAPPTFIAPSPL